MKKRAQIVPTDSLESRILTIRGQKVILDSDLAAIYGVTSKRLNEQVSRNAKRFPSEFMFQLTRKEVVDLRSQIATSSPSHGGRRFLPYAFTDGVRQHEDGVARLRRAARKFTYGFTVSGALWAKG
jgi:hypothetical protein